LKALEHFLQALNHWKDQLRIMLNEEIKDGEGGGMETLSPLSVPLNARPCR